MTWGVQKRQVHLLYQVLPGVNCKRLLNNLYYINPLSYAAVHVTTCISSYSCFLQATLALDFVPLRALGGGRREWSVNKHGKNGAATDLFPRGTDENSPRPQSRLPPHTHGTAHA